MRKKKQSARCPECEEVISLPGPVEVDDLIDCSSCFAELRIVSVAPLKFELVQTPIESDAEMDETGGEIDDLEEDEDDEYSEDEELFDEDSNGYGNYADEDDEEYDMYDDRDDSRF